MRKREEKTTILDEKDLPKIEKFRFWTIRKISFTSILIAIGVIFVIIGTQLLFLASIPTFKISVIGLPIKITGFIFGPIFGVLVGLISDLISFMMFPIFFEPLYILSTMMNGFISGIVGWFFLSILDYYFGFKVRIDYNRRKIRYIKLKIEKLNELFEDTQDPKIQKLITECQIKILYIRAKIRKWELRKSSNLLLNTNMIVSISILATIIVALIIIFTHQITPGVYLLAESVIKNSFIPNRWALMTLLILGFSTMIFFIIVARFKINPKKYTIFVPIVIFSALLEIINVPLLSLADTKLATGAYDLSAVSTTMFAHILLSPIKIWVNLTVIFYTHQIISKLIYKNQEIVY